MTDESTARLGSTVLGYPRIGPRRELKRALEQYWKGTIGESELLAVGREMRGRTWRDLSEAGLDSIPGNTFSHYDHVLDTAVLFGAVPGRYADLGHSDLDTYFAMARGTANVEPLEMTKWFATNYHYLVPEIGPDTHFRLAGDKPVAEYREAAEIGIETRPVLPGPLTFLLLSKADSAAPEGFTPLDKLDELLDAYAALLESLATAGARWVQLDEPAFSADREERELAALRRAYERLAAMSNRPSLLVTGPYGDLGDALDVLAATDVEALGVDLVAGRTSVSRMAELPQLRDKTVLAGVVDGHNIWRSDVDDALGVCATLLGIAGDVAVSTSCSLLHVPYDVDAEPAAFDVRHPRLRSWLAFAKQKVDEVVLLQRALANGQDGVADGIAAARAAVTERRADPAAREERVRTRTAGLRPEDARREPYPERALAQRAKLGLPEIPTTTIGSFPQTSEVRKARAALRDGSIEEAEYTGRMRAEVENVVALQERIGLDVLVHGEPERNDMVQYFAEKLDGYATTELGWVQSYGSRCVRPPILYGDVSRPDPMTVGWSTFAQSLTPKPVKGMLTGPVTMLAWSFVRDDQPQADSAEQVALAIRDEVTDLESAGIGIIQVDEPALRELLPLRAAERAAYLEWAVRSFRLATSGVAAQTQIHTHMCYAEFSDILQAIDDIDADVISIEAARSKMEVLSELGSSGFARGVGPGVYDIHSPRVPGPAEMTELLRAALGYVEADRLWANPDCGLKTRGYTEIEPALTNLVAAARAVRGEITR